MQRHTVTRWLFPAVAFLLASPAWSQQGVTPDTGRGAQPTAKVSKVDALTLKQKSHAAVDVFLKIPDIEGESDEKGRVTEIDVLNWSWGVSNASSGAARTRPAPGRGSLTITKSVDRATPSLAQAATKGRIFRQMTLTLPAAGGGLTTVQLEDVVVASVRRGSGGGRPTETVVFNYARSR